MSEFKLKMFDFDIVSMYPLPEPQLTDLFIRRWIQIQIVTEAYNKGCYQNKINYIVWHLGLDKQFYYYRAKQCLNSIYGRCCY